MTPNRFQDWLSKLEIPECSIDYKFNKAKNRFDIHVSSDVEGVQMMFGSFYELDWLNDTRRTQKMMNEFPGKTVAAFERAGKKFKTHMTNG